MLKARDFSKGATKKSGNLVGIRCTQGWLVRDLGGGAAGDAASGFVFRHLVLELRDYLRKTCFLALLVVLDPYLALRGDFSALTFSPE